MSKWSSRSSLKASVAWSTSDVPGTPGPPGFTSSDPMRLVPLAGWRFRVRSMVPLAGVGVVERHRERGALEAPARLPVEACRRRGRRGRAPGRGRVGAAGGGVPPGAVVAGAVVVRRAPGRPGTVTSPARGRSRRRPAGRRGAGRRSGGLARQRMLRVGSRSGAAAVAFSRRWECECASGPLASGAMPRRSRASPSTAGCSGGRGASPVRTGAGSSAYLATIVVELAARPAAAAAVPRDHRRRHPVGRPPAGGVAHGDHGGGGAVDGRWSASCSAGARRASARG